ncbi:hydrophobic/amphiphilic exporter-1, HAE1 family [Chitinophaga sp. YR573]|uniref:efflux RND transporter permease subunit n=1 Tax=Chitinophaga sp. YR573 TaxID=1881040 RepID=UPI0008D558CD|nr:efflux RND transporter permease subunit [Chitinophaga sp. YR573]SEW44733.1 hydrophobic/amphiphilic exporter-1, HAE1 family [Chitinophaga sp. YR573]
MSITELAIKRPLFITVIFVTLLLFGYISYKTLNYNLLPKFETNMLTVTTTYTGASPAEVKTSVTKPIEDAVAAIEGVDKISSSSQEGMSSVTIELNNDANVKQAQLDAERKINQIKSTLPADADDPIVTRFSSDDQAIMKVSVTSTLTDTKLYDFIDQQVKPLLTNIPGVAQIDITGGTERQINVALDNDKLKAYNISVTDVNQAVVYSGASYPAGSLKSSNTRYSIDLNAKIKNVEDLRNVIIKQNNDGSRIQLKDVAYVTDGQEENTTLNRLNGQPAIGIEIKKQTDANTVKVCQLAAQKLEELKTTYASYGFSYHIAADQSIYTLKSADAVIEDIFLAILIVAAVMLFFLHSARSSSFVLVALPSAMIPTFILMWAFNFSLNLMTLMSLSLVVGILVDDSIVVLENIFRHLEMGKDKRTAALEGRNEIGFTAMAITLVDVVIFLPLALIGGLIGNIVREYSLVVVFSTLMSLFVAFTLTPLLASRWGKLPHLDKSTLWGRINLWFESLIDQFRDFYTNILKWALSHKRYVILLVAVLIIGSVALIPAGFVGAEFIGQSDRGELNIQIDLASQSSLKQTNYTVSQAEKIILKHPEVKDVFSNVGTQQGASIGTNGSSNSNLAELTVTLVDKKDRKISTTDMGKQLREELSAIPGLKPTIKLTGITGNASYDIQIAVKGTNMDSIVKAAAIIKQIVASTPGADYVQYSTKEAKTQVSIVLNRDKMAKFGVSVGDVGSAVQYAFKGNDNTKYRDNGEEYNINLELDDADRNNISNVRNLNIYNSRGGIIPLTEVADIRETLTQSVLERNDRLNSMQINAAAVGRPSGTIMDEIKEKIARKGLPQGIQISEEGFTKNQADSFKSLFMAIGIGVLLIYLIMVALYESVVYPFVVLFSMPVAIIGAVLALALTMKTINVFSLLGIILLLGLVAKNGILIVDFANHQKEKGMSVVDSLIEAGRERIRPILMTTLAMVFGMLPMALSTGAGSETKSAMAWVIIGGLTSSLIFTLILVPSVYMIIESWRIKVNKWVNGKEKAGYTMPDTQSTGQ